MGFFSFQQELAIDLGTANTLIIHNDKVVVNEPSIVAIDQHTGKLIAIGEKARQMHGKTHENIKTIRPLRDGVIADFHAAEQMIRGMIKDDQPKKENLHSLPEDGRLHSLRKHRGRDQGGTRFMLNMQEVAMYI